MSAIAFLNGKIIPANEATIPVTDWGFLQGITLAEQIRTFGHRPFLVDAHLDRLLCGLKMVGWETACSREELTHAISDVVQHNARLIDPQHDLGITVFVTPGLYPIYDPNRDSTPHVGVHTYPLPFQFWQHKYDVGEHLVTVNVRQVPAECWPHELKCRSRMHYYLASREAKSRDPAATAVLLDERGVISETPTANIVAFFEQDGFVSPSRGTILPGISLAFVEELAREQGTSWIDRDLTRDDLARADEIIVTSTPYGLLPVRQFDERRFDVPGPQAIRLLDAWKQRVGIDLVDQARRFRRS